MQVTATSILMALAVLSAASAVSSSNVVYNHQCIVGSPPACNRSLADDTLCRGTYSTDIKAWQSNNCDYVIYDVKAEEPTNKWIVVHAGQCDVDTEWLGDWAHENVGYNLFGLRPCTGLNTQTCTYNRSVCDALHLSWTAYNGDAGATPALGLGYNPTPLINYAKDTNNSFLFLHSFDGMPDYPWAGACNATKPAYVCISSPEDDDEFERKFYGDSGTGGIKDLLESLSMTEDMPCVVEVVDARNSSEVPGVVYGAGFGEVTNINRHADLPCSGMFPQAKIQGMAWELQDNVAQGLYTAILKSQEDTGNGTILDAFSKAIQIALGD